MSQSHYSRADVEEELGSHRAAISRVASWYSTFPCQLKMTGVRCAAAKYQASKSWAENADMVTLCAHGRVPPRIADLEGRETHSGGGQVWLPIINTASLLQQM